GCRAAGGSDSILRLAARGDGLDTGGDQSGAAAVPGRRSRARPSLISSRPLGVRGWIALRLRLLHAHTTPLPPGERGGDDSHAHHVIPTITVEDLPGDPRR